MPGDHLMIDLMHMIKSTDNKNYILTVVDVFTGFVMLRALPDCSAATVARELWDIFCIIGIPKILQSDNGSEFVNEIIRWLCTHRGIAHRVITSWHPESDGKVERSNGTIRQTINKMVKGVHVHWPLYLAFVQLCINTKVHELTLSTPFALMFGRKLNEFADYLHTTKDDSKQSLSEWLQHQEEVISLVYPQIELRARHEQKKYREKLAKIRGRILAEDLPPGTRVMILDEKYLKGNPRPNTEPKYIGEYVVVKREINGPYTIKSPTGEIYQRKVPVDQMKVLFRPKSNIDNEEENVWIVDEILDHNQEGRTMNYKVKWRGYDETSWEPEDNILDQGLIDTYWRKRHGLRTGKDRQSRSATAVVSLVAPEHDTLSNEVRQTARTSRHKMKLLFQQKRLKQSC
jgi:transposase InsO family protein